MRRQKVRMNLEELADQIAEDYDRGYPQTLPGRRVIKGDIFYSDLRRYLPKKHSSTTFTELCRLVEERGIWVHS